MSPLATRRDFEHFHGTKGMASLDNGGRYTINGQPLGGKRSRVKDNPYQLEHDAFFENIRTGMVRIDADYAAHTTMMGIMGRMASYTGQIITWDQAMNFKNVLVPEIIDWDNEHPVKLVADGWYPVAISGTTLPV